MTRPSLFAGCSRPFLLAVQAHLTAALEFSEAGDIPESSEPPDPEPQVKLVGSPPEPAQPAEVSSFDRPEPSVALDLPPAATPPLQEPAPPGEASSPDGPPRTPGRAWSPEDDLILLQGLVEPPHLLAPVVVRLGRGQGDCLARFDLLVGPDQSRGVRRAALAWVRASCLEAAE